MYSTEQDRQPVFTPRQQRVINDGNNAVIDRVERRFDYAVSGLGKRTKQQIVPELMIKWMERMHDRLEAASTSLGEQDSALVQMMLLLYREEIASMKATRDEAVARMEERRNLYRRAPLPDAVK